MATDIINSANLTPQATLQVPTYQPTPVDPSIATSAISSIAGQYEAVNKQLEQAQAEQKTQAESQLSLQNALLGKTQYAQEANDTAGVNTETAKLNSYAQTLADLNAQASSLQREASAIPIANRLQYQQGGVAGTESQVKNVNYDQLQQNALKALSIAQQADIASAALTGSQLKLQAAKDKAQQMVDLKYKPIEDQLAIKKQQYELNKDILSQIDKKRTEALNIAIKQEERQIAEKKELEKSISDIGVTLRKYGVGDSVVQDVLSSKSINEAIIKSGTWLQDPKAKLELEGLRADLALKNAKARLAEKEARFGKEPTEKEKKAQALALQNAKDSASAAQDKIDNIDLILENKVGLASRVGPNILSRGVVAPVVAGAVTGAGLGPVGAVVGGLAGGATGISASFGKGQSFAAQIHNLTSGLTLQELIDAKAKGATFGALTQEELRLLAASASILNDAEIKDKDGKPTGYWNLDERTFTNAVNDIKSKTQKALLKSQNQLVTPEESSTLDQVFPVGEDTTADQYY